MHPTHTTLSVHPIHAPYTHTQVYTFSVSLQVNADIKKFIILEEDKVPRLFDVDTETVGRSISTKQAGSRGREDITHQVSEPKEAIRSYNYAFYGLPLRFKILLKGH